ncbi:MAG: polyprenyl synthetase family protein [Bacteroidia bacterium]|nr:polyprenyl synthetase family protein [Bacteroidia bacterium]
MPDLKNSSISDFKEQMSDRLSNYYSSKIGQINSILDTVIPVTLDKTILKIMTDEFDTPFGLDRTDKAIYQLMRQYLSNRGKLFRPLLTYLFIEGYGKDPEDFKPIVASAEIIHSCSLILDDIADASLLRRGQPCSHQLHGIPRAANASSAMTFFVYRLLQKVPMDLSNDQKIKLYKALLWEHYITSIGSALDLGWVKERKNEIPEDVYIQHIKFRSSSYTYRHASSLGAITGGASEEDLKLIFDYSSVLGVAFQFMDDILNLKPGLQTWGKTIGEDITEGKRSPLVLHTLKTADTKDKDRLMKLLDSKVTSNVELEEAVNILDKYHAFETVKEQADQFALKACNIIERIQIADKHKHLLIDFAKYVVERKI